MLVGAGAGAIASETGTRILRDRIGQDTYSWEVLRRGRVS
jgi:hypothetical protein